MTKAQKAKWIKALRSGKYKQGRAYLYSATANTYCCLGVAECVVRRKPPHAIRGLAMPDDPVVSGNELGVLGVDEALARLNDASDDVGFPAPVPFEVIAGVIDQWVETED